MQSIWGNCQIHFRLNSSFSDEFLALVRLHQAFQHILFSVAMEALSKETESEFPKELLYTNDLSNRKALKKN